MFDEDSSNNKEGNKRNPAGVRVRGPEKLKDKMRKNL